MLGCFLLQSDGAVNSITIFTDSSLSSDIDGNLAQFLQEAHRS